MARGQADGQVVFEVSADTSKIKTAIGDVTDTFEDEGEKWDKDTKDSTDKVAKNFDSMKTSVSSKIKDLTKDMLHFAVNGVNKMLDYSDAVDKGSRSLGISAKAYQELDYAMGMSGTSIESLTRGVGALNSALNGTARAEVAGALSAIGISDEDLASMSSAEELLDNVLYALAETKDAAARADIANQIFGIGAGSQLAAFFDEGETGIKKLRQQAEDLGIVQDDEAIAQAVKTGDAITTLNTTLNAVLMQALTPLLPLIQSVVNFVTPFLPLVTKVADMLTTILTPIMKLAGIDQDKKRAEEQAEADAAAALGKTDWLDAVLAVYRGETETERVTNKMQEKGTNQLSAGQYLVVKDMLKEMGFDSDTATNMAKDAYQLAYHKTFSGGKDLTWAGGDKGWYNNIGAQYADSVDAVNAKNAQLANSLGGVSTAADNAAAAMNGVGAGIGSFGSHANGLDYAPFDGYLALLHQGERIQTAAEADLSRRYSYQQPAFDYSAMGGAIGANIGRGNVYLDGRTVGEVLSSRQANSYRALERSGWQG